MQTTSSQFNKVISECRNLFSKKLRDYGAAWRVLRSSSVIDQIYIKVNRIRTFQMTGVKMVDESEEEAFMAIINYSIIGLIQLEKGISDTIDENSHEIMGLYDRFVSEAKSLMERKNHDYGEAWKEMRMKWHQSLGFGAHKYRFHDHEKLAHYANAATDIEFEMPFGFKEVEGIHSRTDFDLSQHEQFSGKKMQYFDPELGKSYTPYVVETSIGVDRMFLSVMAASFCEEMLEGGESRVVLKLPPALAPVKLAVLPLIKKDGLPEKAREIIDNLKFDFACQYDEKDSIGKRYRRQDAIGTPFCVTIDHQTLEDNTVTIRHRDTMEQERVAIDALERVISEKTDMKYLLKAISK
jgi:glycyl-tRNA synthetase (class II)